jgi:hypothetical protein
MIKLDFVGSGSIINAFAVSGQADEIYESITGQEHPQKVERQEQSFKLSKIDKAIEDIINNKF